MSLPMTGPCRPGGREAKLAAKPTAEVLQIRQPTSLKVGRVSVRVAVAQTPARCVPVPLGNMFRNIVAVHPIIVKLGNGWKRLGRSER